MQPLSKLEVEASECTDQANSRPVKKQGERYVLPLPKAKEMFHIEIEREEDQYRAQSDDAIDRLSNRLPLGSTWG